MEIKLCKINTKLELTLKYNLHKWVKINEIYFIRLKLILNIILFQPTIYSE